MTSIILSGATIDDRALYLKDNYPDKVFRITHITDIRTIPIKSVSSLSQDLAISSTMPRLIWIEEADRLSLPAQHSLLKLLEEPPPSTTILLSLDNNDSLLETINSRATHIKLQSTHVLSNTNSLEFIKSLLTSNPGKRISLISEIPQKREDLLAWLHQTILDLESKIDPASSPAQLSLFRSILESTITAENRISANCNIHLALTDYVLSLPKAR